MSLKRILIVDDVEDNRVILQDWLEEDYELFQAATGVEALEFLEQESIDLVLLDLSLPEMSGLEVIEKIRKSPKFLNLPVIAVTAYTSSADESEALKAGFDAFLAKPFKVKLLFETIEAALKET